MLTAHEILQMVGLKHKVPWLEFFRQPIHDSGKCPVPQSIATAKAEAAWELRARLNLSYPQVATLLRLKSHTSALYLCKQHERRQRKRAAQRHNAAVLWLTAPAGTGEMFARRAQAARDYKLTCECGTCSKCRNREYKRRWYAKHRPENQSVSVCTLSPPLS